jgi:hypothetical protein
MLGLVDNLGGDSLSPMNIEIYVRGGGAFVKLML